MTSCSSHPLLEAGLLKNEQMADLFGDDEHSDKRHLNEENEAFRKKWFPLDLFGILLLHQKSNFLMSLTKFRKHLRNPVSMFHR